MWGGHGQASMDPMAPSGRRNFWLNVADGIWFPAGYALMGPATVLPLFIAAMTSSGLAIGLASALIQVGIALPQLPSARITETTPRYWRWFCWSNGVLRLTVLPWIVLPFLPMPWRLWLLYPAIALFALSWGVAAPSWADLVGRVIPPELRGRFFGWRQALQGPASVLATLGAAALLAHLAPTHAYAACFALAFVLMGLSFVCLAATRHPWPLPVPAATGYWRALPGRLRGHPEFMRYALARLVLTAGTAGLAFAVVEGQHRFGLSSDRATLLGLALLALPTLTGVFWGRSADRWGARVPLAGALLLGTLGGIVAALAPSWELYAAGLALMGLVQPLLVMADYQVIYATCPEERATWFGLFALLQLPAALLVPLGAGLLAEQAGMAAVLGGAAVAWLPAILLVPSGIWRHDEGRAT